MNKEKQLQGNIYLQIRKEGNEIFYNIKLKKKIEAVLCIDGINKNLYGMPRIVYRRNNKTYGDQIYFQFWIMEKGEKYPPKTKWENFEYYLNGDDGVKLMSVALQFINSIKENLK